MNTSTMFSGNVGEFSQFLWYLLLTAHICLFVDLSPLRKKPNSQSNYLAASFISALLTSMTIRLIPFSSFLLKHAIGVSLALLLSIAVTLLIQASGKN